MRMSFHREALPMSTRKSAIRAQPARGIPDYLPDEDAAPLALRRYILNARFPHEERETAARGWRASLRAWWRQVSAQR
ncbi:hypothetical protein [Chromobacterium aquaticum]|uniref:Uncharacterized protein n=1 Tax=Chromobacterium aquaticum TaxID=467180 RepID=A0ABV8ZNH9_9NEIS|nr:hypothetical protein [Chromobacterium aquaticum]MCD5360752.1 hypothetical protein [Chromobacterium aquaticum]